jgi:hypothetical protein
MYFLSIALNMLAFYPKIIKEGHLSRLLLTLFSVRTAKGNNYAIDNNSIHEYHQHLKISSFFL